MREKDGSLRMDEQKIIQTRLANGPISENAYEAWRRNGGKDKKGYKWKPKPKKIKKKRNGGEGRITINLKVGGILQIYQN